ncbi:MAG: hypothetical protein AW11_02868 [Candidatus Accumulibacter regalis]|jgi:hypothetical protein|uniref:Uncharacterized protein n=3 Tax=Candidatus Accumulibacter TaxID=327159 RepID=A0A011NWJ2_ACCRE|nr:MAG: hypothetical protein AW10_04247 [Candidatus Accumulibacter appositus]EXI87073.1 MAG: hypothetical protein AW11_02868 [Candidatus Accumulibacter regalis]
MPQFAMTLALPEFSRQLQPMLPGWQVQQPADGCWLLHQAGRSVDIRCRPLPALQVGILQLPRLDVSIAFSGGSAEEQATFIADFQRHFRRGGG